MSIRYNAVITMQIIANDTPQISTVKRHIFVDRHIWCSKCSHFADECYIRCYVHSVAHLMHVFHERVALARSAKCHLMIPVCIGGKQ